MQLCIQICPFTAEAIAGTNLEMYIEISLRSSSSPGRPSAGQPECGTVIDTGWYGYAYMQTFPDTALSLASVAFAGYCLSSSVTVITGGGSYDLSENRLAYPPEFAGASTL
jgi:hypothetical protein